MIKGTARTLGLLELAEAAVALERSTKPQPSIVEDLADAEAAARAAAAAYMASVGG